MVHFAPANCQHLDNWRRCKVHAAPWFIRWLMPKGRPPCVLDVYRALPSQDGDDTCPDQKPYPRPAPPQSGSGVIPDAHLKRVKQDFEQRFTGPMR